MFVAFLGVRSAPTNTMALLAFLAHFISYLWSLFVWQR